MIDFHTISRFNSCIKSNKILWFKMSEVDLLKTHFSIKYRQDFYGSIDAKCAWREENGKFFYRIKLHDKNSHQIIIKIKFQTKGNHY